MSSDSDREQELRRLLADAVEPIEPSPGSQTRLLARARAQQRCRQRPLMERLRVPAAAVSLLTVIGLVVVLVSRAGDRSNGSSASSTAAGAASAAGVPPRAAESSSAATAAQGALPSAAASPKAPSKELSRGAAASRSYSTSGLNPNAPVAAPARPSDLDGDGRADTFTLSGRILTANLSRDGRQTVTLPPVGPRAFVLFVSTLEDPNGQAVAVLFVRLRAASQSATDTIVALVDGRLAVLQQGSGPVLLTIDRTHGYVCSQRALALAGETTPFVVDGSQLVATRQLEGAVAAPAKAYGC